MKPDNFFNEKYQREMATLKTTSVLKNDKGRAAAAMISMMGEGQLSCEHVFYYPMLMLHEGKVIFPTKCLEDGTYYLLEFRDKTMREIFSSQDAKTAKENYDLIGMPELFSMSGSCYKSDKMQQMKP